MADNPEVNYLSKQSPKDAFKPVIGLIVPCFNELDVLDETNVVLLKKIKEIAVSGKISGESFILYVDDGSIDGTWRKIVSFSNEDNNVKGIRLSGNRGFQNAMLAGMEYVADKCDAAITIDADLQDDPQTIETMINSYREGADIVCGVRNNRDSDTWFKRNTALSFYKIMKALGVECVYNHADFRLMSRRAILDLLDYGERNIFLRGLVPRLGYKQENIYYSRGVRKAGTTKYPFRKMVEFAIDGITSFSVKPVRMLFWLGLFFMLAALAIGIYTLIRYFTGETVEGWTSLILSIWFCTGILLIGMGIMGEYIGKIYIEVKHRPRYKIVDET